MHDPLDLRDVLADELVQRRQSGFDVGEVGPQIEYALASRDVPPALLGDLLERLERTAPREDWPYLEDDGAPTSWIRRADLPSILVARDERLTDRLLGAWLGRCAGCLLGKPVEGWTAANVATYLHHAGIERLDDYVPFIDPWPDDVPPFKPSWREATRARIAGMARDDDLDYTVSGLLVLERTSSEPSTDDVADEWLTRLPIGRTYTAERAAYRNLINGLPAAAAARCHNPYREWIGALIRVDAYAYVSPGDPCRAAELAARDAALSHVGNGVAAAMWAASVISLSLAGMTPRDAVSSAMACVPAESRLNHALRDVLDLHDAGEPWEAFRARASRDLARYGWVHAIPNTATIAASLLWGGGEFSRTIELAVRAGGDTDSNAATAGSACGAMIGAAGLPRQWVDPLEDTLRTAVAEVGTPRISDLAKRCERLVPNTVPVAAHA